MKGVAVRVREEISEVVSSGQFHSSNPLVPFVEPSLDAARSAAQQF